MIRKLRDAPAPGALSLLEIGIGGSTPPAGATLGAANGSRHGRQMLLVRKWTVALDVHSVVQDPTDFDNSSGSCPVQKKVTSAMAVPRDVERTKTLHDLVPGLGPGNLGTIGQFANGANERIPIAQRLPRAEILSGPF
jgi:hypothetical protein